VCVCVCVCVRVRVRVRARVRVCATNMGAQGRRYSLQQLRRVSRSTASPLWSTAQAKGQRSETVELEWLRVGGVQEQRWMLACGVVT
jgi:hypothetical protein